MASGGGDINPGVGEDPNMDEEQYDDPIYGPNNLPNEYSKLSTCCLCAADTLLIYIELSNVNML